MAIAVCAHRGASISHPENTVAAFRAAAELGVERVEFDVRRTLDGELVILHDHTVDRTTNGCGAVWELTACLVRGLDAGSHHSAAFAGERIPTFAEAVDACPMRLNIHVYPGPHDLEPLLDGVLAELRNQGRLDSAFITGDDAVVDRTALLEPGITRCWLGGQHLADYPEQSAARGCRNLQPWYPNLSAALCDRAHELGLEVHPFYADDEARMRELIAMGVDGMLTNQPALLQQVIA